MSDTPVSPPPADQPAPSSTDPAAREPVEALDRQNADAPLSPGFDQPEPTADPGAGARQDPNVSPALADTGALGPEPEPDDGSLSIGDTVTSDDGRVGVVLAVHEAPAEAIDPATGRPLDPQPPAPVMVGWLDYNGAWLDADGLHKFNAPTGTDQE